MSNEIADARDKLNKYYSKLVKELNNQIEYFEKEKEEVKKDKKEYQSIIDDLECKINEIKNDENNYIGENKEENNLLPDKLHEMDFLNKRKVFYKNILDDLKSRESSKLNELDKKISECKKTIDKYNFDIETVKQAIWRDGVIKIKINEIIDLKELNKYIHQNEAMLNIKK